MTPELTDLAEPVLGIAREAGRRILEIYETDFRVTEKADQSPLTTADLAAHKIIVTGLSALTPSIPVVSEEAPTLALSERSQWEWLWLVDPLDGTREFIRRSGQFSINIALIHKQTAVFGLIFIPVSRVCYTAYRHGGACKRLANGESLPMHARQLGDHPLCIATSSRSYRSRFLQSYLQHLGHFEHLSVGGALKSCLIAEGQADLYPRFGPTGEWDTAAAQIIVEEAGGGFTDIHMRPLRYNTRPTMINPDFFVFGDAGHDWSQYLHRHM